MFRSALLAALAVLGWLVLVASTEANTPPIVTDSTVEVPSVSNQVIYLKVGDAELSNYYLKCFNLSTAMHGTVAYRLPAIYPTNSYLVEYSPDPGFVGEDLFSYQVTVSVMIPSAI